MINVSERDAIGASVFAALADEASAVGPVVRYRRWLRPPTSLDVALGISVEGDVAAGSAYGLVKLNAVHWFGVAARPELLRVTEYTCGPTTCATSVASRGRFSLGMEVGWIPGLVVTVSSGVVLLGLVAAYAAGS